MKGIIILLASVVVLLSLSVSLQFKNDREARDQQREQIIYLCTVARVIDPVIIARFQDTSITPSLRAKFRAAHIVLSQTKPCGRVEG